MNHQDQNDVVHHLAFLNHPLNNQDTQTFELTKSIYSFFFISDKNQRRILLDYLEFANNFQAFEFYSIKFHVVID